MSTGPNAAMRGNSAFGRSIAVTLADRRRPAAGPCVHPRRFSTIDQGAVRGVKYSVNHD